MTKKDKACLYSYRHAQYKSVHEAYNRPSYAKHNIEQHIISDMHLLDGYDYRVTTHNTFAFCAGFCFMDKSTGKEHLMYYTPSSTRDIELD